MSLNPRQYVTLDSYQPGIVPQNLQQLPGFLALELPRMANAITQLQTACQQATSVPPQTPLEGMVRLAVLPWNPLNTNQNELVVYKGGAWVAI